MDGLLADGKTLAAAGVAGAGVGIAAGMLYRFAKRKPKNVLVNCWFCNENTTVPYGNQNCWDCPHCEQYNGFREDGDYNKPIPAQHSEYLNHGTPTGGAWEATRSSGGAGAGSSGSVVQQWVSSRHLLCRRCAANQQLKIRQIANFTPRSEDSYDDEVELYRHHLEQTYRLCRPCQTAVECYIRHQDRQIRTRMLDLHARQAPLGRYADKLSPQQFSARLPKKVVLLRVLAFACCAALVATAMLSGGTGGSQDTAAGARRSPSVPPGPPVATNQAGGLPPRNGTGPRGEQAPGGGTGTGAGAGTGAGTATGTATASLLETVLLYMPVPEGATEFLHHAWGLGEDHRLGLACCGLSACLLSVLLAGRLRVRRIDAWASLLWLLLLLIHVAERYAPLTAATTAAAASNAPSDWLSRLRLPATCLCAAVGLAAAVATRRPAASSRGPKPRRPFGGSLGPSPLVGVPRYLLSVAGGYAGGGGLLTLSPTPPPPFLLAAARHDPRPAGRRAMGSRLSPSSLPTHLHRVLSLGTAPAVYHAEPCYLLESARPVASPPLYKANPFSDTLSVASWSRPVSPSCLSTSGSLFSDFLTAPRTPPPPPYTPCRPLSPSPLRPRRPLISPARLVLGSSSSSAGAATGTAAGASTASSSSTSSPPTPPGSVVAPGDCCQDAASAPRSVGGGRTGLPSRASMPCGGQSVYGSSDVCSDKSGLVRDSSSGSSQCPVDTTTHSVRREDASCPSRAHGGSPCGVLQSALLGLSLLMNLLFGLLYLHHGLPWLPTDSARGGHESTGA
ncbi:transmembrane protein 201 [Lampetra planeri]